MHRRRLAVEGEELVAHEFKNGAVEMVSQLNFEHWRSAPESADSESREMSWLLKHLRKSGYASCEDEPGPVVEIPSDALLRICDICPVLQERYHLHLSEDALFIGFRETICFGNGVIIPLQLLHEGQVITVVRRSWAESLEAGRYGILMSARKHGDTLRQ